MSLFFVCWFYMAYAFFSPLIGFLLFLLRLAIRQQGILMPVVWSVFGGQGLY